MDLVLDLDLTAPDVIATLAQRRTAHEEQQRNVVGIAQGTPGAQPHVVVPWNDNMSKTSILFNSTMQEVSNNGLHFLVVTICQH